MSLAFFDTNVLIYADDPSVPKKHEAADTLFAEHLERGVAALSPQVLQEYYSTVTRKLGVPPHFAQRRIEIFSRANVVRFEVTDVIAAIELHRLSRISFWDAMIVHAARLSGAAVLYSEDFQHGSILGGVRVVNPFISEND
jgi:predicted nucleic acid-binding protein